VVDDRVRPWIDDMLYAIDWIERITAGKSLHDYRADRPMRDAVERNIERISEASRHLPNELTVEHTQISWRQIAQVATSVDTLIGGSITPWCRKS
jgi:uncharacterized protein with HEPN domain